MPDLRGNVMRHVNVRPATSTATAESHDEVKRGSPPARSSTSSITSTACSSSTGCTDPTTLTTWAQFERWHRAAFVERITAFVERVGS